MGELLDYANETQERFFQYMITPLPKQRKPRKPVTGKRNLRITKKTPRLR